MLPSRPIVSVIRLNTHGSLISKGSSQVWGLAWAKHGNFAFPTSRTALFWRLQRVILLALSAGTSQMNFGQPTESKCVFAPRPNRARKT